MQGGVLRVVDGRSCDTQFSLTDVADRLLYASNNAIGDLDGDGGRPEVVVPASPGAPGGLVAFGYDGSAFVRRWYGRRCDLAGEPRFIANDWANNNVPALYDLDDDGVPEVLHGRFVYDANGCVLNPGQSYDNYLRLGVFAVVSDVDADGEVELVYPDGFCRWTGSDRAIESYWAPADSLASRFGYVAIADLGDFGAGEPGAAEIVVVSAPSLTSTNTATGSVRVMTPSGRIVFGPYDLPAESGQVAGRGGPPTIGDFDGEVFECRDGNNRGVSPAVFCGPA